ncbi:DUF4376 domain-containing protein [Sphingosinicella sp. CPCC 101087]|uniref:DUF4376 domain-containing protein n=1 Tax=Sphingosinicella sp. CPCC 101087 TaxID=2497754 RepID=UPI00101B8BE6|nr:DUF4376 domain-containing protein [Sphingosinicella sp. CPCC 101087]
MSLLPHLETSEGLVRLFGNPILDRLDGEARAPLLTIVSGAWTEQERAAYGIVMAEPQLVPTPLLVDVERDRRVYSGITFAGMRFQTREQDLRNIDTTLTFAMAALAQGGGQPEDYFWHGGDQPFVWIAEDNTLVPMDAATFASFAAASTWRRADHILAARTIKDMNPIPADFTDDSYWPEV